MTDLSSYLAQTSDSIFSSEEPLYFQAYLRGQLELSVGNYADAVKFLEAAFKSLENIIQEEKSINDTRKSAKPNKEPLKSSTSTKSVVKSKSQSKSIDPQQPAIEKEISRNVSEVKMPEGVEDHTLSTIGGLLATSYDYLGEIEIAEEYFKKVMTVDPTGPLIGEYAVFLHRRKKDYVNAESFYRKAVELYPELSSITLKYAGFLRHIKKDIVAAHELYQKACDSNPNNSDALGNFASFLHGSVGDMAKAEHYYEKAYAIDSLHANNLCNYGLFLSEEKKNFAKAETLYTQVLEISPDHANTLYNFGVMLDTHCSRKGEAESLYRRAIVADPKHAYALYNLAVLLEEKIALLGVNTKNDSRLKEVQEMYSRAIEIDGADPTTLADYGRFLILKLEDTENGERYLNRALSIDQRNEVALYHLGILHYRFAKETNKAQEFFRQVLVLNKNHVGSLHHLGRIVSASLSDPNKIRSDSLDRPRDDVLFEAMEFFEKAITASEDATSPLIDYAKVVLKIGGARHKSRCVIFSKPPLEKLKASKSMQNNQIAAISELLEKIAASIASS